MSATKLKFGSITKVLLASLVFSTKVQARQSLNPEAVADYTEKAKAAKEHGADFPYPALEVVKRGEELLVISGFTRGKAAKAAGYEEVPVKIAEAPEITDQELFELAITANLTHGARLTNADKTHNVVRAFKFPELAELSDNALAERLGVSTTIIKRNRPATASAGPRKSKTGKTIDTANIGKKGGKTAKQKAAKKGKTESTPATGDAKKEEPAKDKFDAKTEQSVRRVTTLLKEKYPTLRASLEDGSLPLSAAEINAWSGTSDGRIQKVAALVIEKQWKPTAAFKLLDKPTDSATKVEHLVNLALASGGVVSLKFGEYGEKIEDQPGLKVLVWDTDKFDVTVTPKK